MQTFNLFSASCFLHLQIPQISTHFFNSQPNQSSYSSNYNFDIFLVSSSPDSTYPMHQCSRHQPPSTHNQISLPFLPDSSPQQLVYQLLQGRIGSTRPRIPRRSQKVGAAACNVSRAESHLCFVVCRDAGGF